MALLPKALCIFGVLLAIGLQFSNGSRIPRMCKCPTAIPSLHPRNIKDFSIEERADGCGTEIILKTNMPNMKEICLDPLKKQGEKFLNCWTNMIQRDESRKAECLRWGPKPRTGTEAAGVKVTKELLFPTSTPHFTSPTISS